MRKSKKSDYHREIPVWKEKRTGCNIAEYKTIKIENIFQKSKKS